MLAFIESSRKRDAFNAIVQSFNSTLVDDGVRHKMYALFSYFESTWLSGNIDVQLWYFSGCNMNTNNICESFHSGFTAAFPKAVKPDLFKLVNRILEYEEGQCELLESVSETDFFPRMKKCKSSVQDKLDGIKWKYNENIIPSLKNYLMALSNSFGNSIDTATCCVDLETDEARGIDEVEYLKYCAGTPEIGTADNGNGIKEAAQKYISFCESQAVGLDSTVTSDAPLNSDGEQDYLYPPYSQDELTDHIRSFMNDNGIWDNDSLSLLNCPQPRDFSLEQVQVFPVSFKELKTLKEVCWDK